MRNNLHFHRLTCTTKFLLNFEYQVNLFFPCARSVFKCFVKLDMRLLMKRNAIQHNNIICAIFVWKSFGLKCSRVRRNQLNPSMRNDQCTPSDTRLIVLFDFMVLFLVRTIHYIIKKTIICSANFELSRCYYYQFLCVILFTYASTFKSKPHQIAVLFFKF